MSASNSPAWPDKLQQPHSSFRRTLKTHLQLGRVSNLPSVWSNVLAAAVLSGATLNHYSLALAMIGFSLFYCAGMYLNDACDAQFDRQYRRTRPIPAMHISVRAVQLSALVLFISGFICLGIARHLAPAAEQSQQLIWLLCVSLLTGAIVLYNYHHKNNPASPLIMAGCRVLVLFGTAFTLSHAVSTTLLLAAALLVLWLIGLTWLAKQEDKTSITVCWPLSLLFIPVAVAVIQAMSQPLMWLLALLLAAMVLTAFKQLRSGNGAMIGASIGLLISGISLVDAILIGAAGGFWPVFACVLCCALTLAGQRFIKGT